MSPKSDATKSDLMANNHGYYSKAVLITWLLYTKSETLYTIIQWWTSVLNRLSLTMIIVLPVILQYRHRYGKSNIVVILSSIKIAKQSSQSIPPAPKSSSSWSCSCSCSRHKFTPCIICHCGFFLAGVRWALALQNFFKSDCCESHTSSSLRCCYATTSSSCYPLLYIFECTFKYKCKERRPFLHFATDAPQVCKHEPFHCRRWHKGFQACQSMKIGW